MAVDAIVAGASAAFWRDEAADVRATVVDDGVDERAAAEVLEQDGAGLLLSACGLYNRMEHTFRIAAARSKVPIVAVLDSWLNYGERFERREPGGLVRSWPDVVCVPDRRSGDGMRQSGFHGEVVVTGPPNLEAAVERASAIDATTRAERRAQLGAAPGDPVVVFFSEPFYTGPDAHPFTGAGGLAHDDGSPLFGYTPPEILDVVISELDQAAAEAGRVCRIVVKPHPLENPAPLERLIGRAPRGGVVTTLSSDPPAAWICVADVAIGMMTIALLEAGAANMPAISVEIGFTGLASDDPCIASVLGYARSVLDRPALRDVARSVATLDLAALMQVPSEPLAIVGATDRVVTVIERALRGVQPSRR
jgi:hypothetical protein